MRIGIIGLPNSGKTTIFNVLTGGSAPTAAYTGGTFQVNTAVVNVPDERLDKIATSLDDIEKDDTLEVNPDYKPPKKK